MKRISFYPLDLRDDNSYISRMYQAIKMVDKNVSIDNLNLKKNFRSFVHSDIFWLNWYESLDNRNLHTVVYSILKKTVELTLMKLCGGKILVVVHNKQPHEVLYYRLNIWFMKCLLRCSHTIIILSDESKSIISDMLGTKGLKKTVKISHPSYKCIPKRYSSKRPEKFIVLFSGLIRPYKNIELLLDLALKHPEFDFIISGNVLNPAYGDILKSKAKNASNIHLEYKYNTDDELNDLMEKASVLVLPYHTKSSLNSGMAMYAFSKGLNVVIPEIGTVKDLKNRNLVFTYTYANEQEHYIALEMVLLNAYNLFINDYEKFVLRAETIRKEVECNCSLEAISNQIRAAHIL